MTSNVLKYALAALLLIGGLIYLVNASWLAPLPAGDPFVISHRGVYQQYDRVDLGRDDCTATRIFEPRHDWLENTLPSMAEAFRLGADAVELDIHPTADGHFVVFHDWTLDCRTDGTGVTRQHPLAYLQSLDVGYGYTADGGKTFPFRGKGVGMMPSLVEVYAAFPGKQFILNVKSNNPREAEWLHRYLQAHGLLSSDQPLSVYGGQKVMQRMRELVPDSVFPTRQQAKECARQYVLWGWSGVVPVACRNAAFIVPLNKTALLWGWPNRFLARMRDAGTHVVLMGHLKPNEGLNGIKSAEELQGLPPGFDGGIWVESIETLGPVLKSLRE